MKLIEPPIGILLTMPRKWFEETGHTPKSCLQHMMFCLNSQENGEWLFLKTSLPTQDFQYVYIVFDGKVQLRANLSTLERNTSYHWCDTPDGKERVFENKNWIVLCGPAIKAPYDIPMKGFQGHRYLTKELF
jgi:hypothetical protein